MATTRRKTAVTPLDVLRARLKAFLAFLKPRLHEWGADLDRLAQLRRLSDVRVRQHAIGKPQVTGLDLCALLSDPRTGRLETVVEGVLRPAHFAQPIEPLSIEMGYLVEACLILQVAGQEKLAAAAKDFVAAQGPVAEVPGAAVARPAGPAPLPDAVARLLGSVRELWAAPAHVVKALQLLAAASSPPDAVAAEVLKDSALAALVVRLADQTPSGQVARPSSIPNAIAAVGYPVLRRVVAASALLSPLAGAGGGWPASLRAGHAAALVARATKLGNPDEHFFAGLLQNVGALALAKHRPDVAGKTDDALVGASILDRWRFPAAIVEAARHRNAPPERFEEIQVPREALVGAAAWRLDAAWAPFLRLTPERLKEVAVQSAALADAAAGAFA
jgi:HD-like signal output (HDOD) protein